MPAGFFSYWSTDQSSSHWCPVLTKVLPCVLAARLQQAFVQQKHSFRGPPVTANHHPVIDVLRALDCHNDWAIVVDCCGDGFKAKIFSNTHADLGPT